MSFFQVENLSISFGGLKALEDIGFEVSQGEIYAIIGPNGAGKTTLFNCINGIYRPDTGTIRFKGKNDQRQKNRTGSPGSALPGRSRISNCSTI